MPANAAGNGGDPAKNSQGQCLATPSHWVTTTTAEVSHLVTTVTPGTEEVSHIEQRWSREVPGVNEVSHREVKFQRTVPGVDEVSHEQWKYLKFTPGLKELSHTEGQFSRENPGQQEVSHTEGQFSRENPGQQERSHQEYKYSKPSSITETQYKKPDVKTQYKYQKYVKGVVLVKYGNQWVPTGDTFDWEVWQGNLTQWSFENKPVLESGPHDAVQAEWTEKGKTYRKVTTNYQYQNTGITQEVPTGTFTFGWFASNPGSPWVSTGTTRQVAGPTLYYNNGNWTTDVNPAGWTKIDQRTVIDQAAVAPFTEYRAQDGSATTDVNNAGWFTENSFSGWSPFGTRKTVIDQAATPDKTEYLTRDSEGNLGTSTDEADASTFTSSNGVGPEWTEYDREKVVDSVEIPSFTAYLTVHDGVLGESTNPLEASWIAPDNPLIVLAIWQQMVDEFGNPLTRIVVDQKAVEGYTEYYVPGGEPTRELGESNWTTDEPEGWTFVDDRKVVDKKAVPPVTTVTKVVDKEASSTKTLVPATYDECELASTGSDPMGPAGWAGLALAVGVPLVVAGQRGRHRRAEANNS